MLRRVAFGSLGLAGAAIATWLEVVAGTSLVWDLMGVHDQDGGGAMALGLVIGPVEALDGGVIGGFAGVIPAGRDPRTAGVGKAAGRRPALAMAAGAVAGAIAGHVGVRPGLQPVFLLGLPGHVAYWLQTWFLLPPCPGAAFAGTRLAPPRAAR
jgi:hypothetical protein